MSDLTFIHKIGADFETVFDDLAALRIAVFRAYPYLYEGTVVYEKQYLQTYSRSPRAFLFAVYDGPKMIGATTCIPLLDETPEVQAPFVKAGYPLEEVFYFGESILLPEYRGRGLGHRFFEERERHAASFGTYRMTCFCAVDRPVDHPLRPAGYEPLDTFWTKRGYVRTPALESRFSWRDIGDEDETEKKMVYWVRSIPSSSQTIV